MSRQHLASLLSNLALGLAGTCLVVAEIAFLPELQLLLAGYLLLILLPYRRPHQWMLPNWVANLLGVAILLGSLFWFWIRLQKFDAREGSMIAALIPFLGPLLLGLLLVRLYRPRSSDEFWYLQGLGLLQVCLGCVLASGTLFGLVMLAYLLVAVAALIAHELQAHRPGEVVFLRAETAQKKTASEWALVLSQLRGAMPWLIGMLLFALPLFLLTPRLDSNDWSPLDRFGVQQGRSGVAFSGLGEEIDLNKSGRLELDESVAFTVRVHDSQGQPTRLPWPEPRWRGLILDRYENGIWANDLAWPTGAAASGVIQSPGPDDLQLSFSIPGNLGTLVLAEPILLGPRVGMLPVERTQEQGLRRMPLFFEAGGTAVPLTHLDRPEVFYRQFLPRFQDRDRYPAIRLREAYIRKLSRYQEPIGIAIGQPDLQLRTYTHQLLLEATRRQRTLAYQALQQILEKQRQPEPLPAEVWEAAARLLYEHLMMSGLFGYSTEYQRKDLTIDPVMDFLLNIREGTCERFAGCLAAMLRSQGIPSRIIKGFRGGDVDKHGEYTVRQSHAHAWVEVLVLAPNPKDVAPSYHWIIYDPTPSEPLPGNFREALSEWWASQKRQGVLLWRDLILGYGTRQQATLWANLVSGSWLIWAVPLLLMALATMVVALWWQRRRRRRRIVPDSVALFERLRQLLRLKTTVGHTPRELANQASDQLASNPRTTRLADIPGGIVDLLYRSRFGEEPVDSDQLLLWRTRLDELEASLSRG